MNGPVPASAMTVTYPTDHEVVAERLFDAPRDLLFRVFTDPALIPHWWGPARYATRVETMDVRPGGSWRYLQTSRDGQVFGFHGTYREIVPPDRLVYTFEFEGEPGHEVLITVTLEAVGEKTRLVARSRFDTAEDMRGMVEAGMESGMREGYDRLEEISRSRAVAIASAREPGRSVVQTRLLAAPKATVFEAWTQADHLVQWWGPHGFTITIQEIDVRPGGVWRFVMHGPDGRDYDNEIRYLEVEAPERLVFLHGDEADPDAFRTEVTFVEEAGKTRVTMRQEFASQPDRDRVVTEHDAVEGGSQTLDRLAEHLARG
jgi:uncharacterized protein YndB with AHSA1/START domain